MSLGFRMFDGASVFAGARQPWSRHARKKRREDLVRCAVGLRHPPRRDKVGRADGLPRRAGFFECSDDGIVSTSPERREVLAHMHRTRSDGVDQSWDLLVGASTHDEEFAVELGVEFA